jgi:hypothetical protein
MVKLRHNTRVLIGISGGIWRKLAGVPASQSGKRERQRFLISPQSNKKALKLLEFQGFMFFSGAQERTRTSTPLSAST